MRWIPVAVLCVSCASSTSSLEPAQIDAAPGASDTPQTANFWTGTWKGEFGGTQEFAQLELQADGHFRYQLTSGPDTSCCSEGSWTADQQTLTLTPDGGSCKAPGLVSYSHIYTRSAQAFALADPAYLEHVQADADGKLSGPVWMFERDPGKAPECP